MATTHNGKQGGLLKGKRHYDKNGKPLGGIKAIVTDTGQMVELEGGEVIINREASKKHWRELSRINQSAGGGVPILPPDTVEADTEEYKNGGTLIEFNPNVLPNKWVYDYAKKIKENYPKVWEQYANVYGNEAFENLGNALKRGYWYDSEEWFYYKWKAFNSKHKGTTTLKDVLASLKWCNVNKKGWGYMKHTIEKEIKKQYPTTEKLKKGKKVEEVKAKTYKQWLDLMRKDNNAHNRNAHEDDVIPFWEWVWEMGAMYGFKPIRDASGDTKIVRTPNNPPNKEDVVAYIKANKGVYADEDGDLDEHDEERLAEDVAEHFNIDVFDAYGYMDTPDQMKLGGTAPIITPKSEKHLAPAFVTDEDVTQIIPSGVSLSDVNGILSGIGVPIQVTKELGSGAYGTAFKTNRGTVLKITEVPNEAYASYVISKSNFKSQAKVYNVFKVTDGNDSIYFIEKEFVKVAKDTAYQDGYPFGEIFGEAFSTGSSRIDARFTNKDLVVRAKDFYEEWLEELSDRAKTRKVHNEIEINGIKEFKRRKKYIVERIYNLFVFYRDLAKESGTKRDVEFNDVHPGNFGEVGDKFVCFDCVSRGEKSFMLGGELKKGIEIEKEHTDTLKKLFQHKITLKDAPKHIAKDHLKEDKKYYTKLAEMESKFAGGGGLGGDFKVGDKVVFYSRTDKRENTGIIKKIRPDSVIKTKILAEILVNGKIQKTAIANLKKADEETQETDDIYALLKGRYSEFFGYLRNKHSNVESVDVEERSGVFTIGFKNKKDSVVYATPFWEDSDGIPVAVEFNNGDHYAIGELVVKRKTFKDFDDFKEWYSGQIEAIYEMAYAEEYPRKKPDTPKTEPRKEIKVDVGYTLETPTGEPSKLTYLQQMLVRTEAFKKYFGDWEASARDYIANPAKRLYNFYKGVSKNIDLVTLEPRIMYHGTMTDKEFFVFEANRNDKGRPYAYFAVNKEYAENFTTSSQRGSGDTPVMYECFLNVKNPFMAIGAGFEMKREGAEYWLSEIAEVILWDKLYTTKEENQAEYDVVYNTVYSQIGRWAEALFGGAVYPFWTLMANDRESTFKYFLISHGYDSIMYCEEYKTRDYDPNNPAEYTSAVAIFDSSQIKLGDGRNLDFNKENPDIRYEDGGTLKNSVIATQSHDNAVGGTHTPEPTKEPKLTKKDALGRVLFGDKYEVMERGGEVAIPPKENATSSDDRAYVDSLIAKMKD